MTSSYYNPVTDLTYEKGADDIWRVEIGSGSAESLHYLGSITPPTDPASKIADPKDGDFYVYDADGAAWNGDIVVAGYWVVFNPSNGWENLAIRITSGVDEVNVSGGILSLAGTASKPVINLDAIDLETLLDVDYLRVDGTNSYDAATLDFSSAVALKATTHLDITADTNPVVRFSSSLAEFSVPLSMRPEAPEIQFQADGRLNELGGEATLQASGVDKFGWDTNGTKLYDTLDANSNIISNVADPIAGTDAVNKDYLVASMYVLPEATTVSLGGVKVGDSLTISLDGTLNVDPTGTFLPLAGGDVTGLTTISGAIFTIRHSNGGTGATPGEFTIVAKDNANVFRVQSGDTPEDGTAIFKGKIESSDSVTTKEYVEDNFLALTGGALTGAVSMTIDSPTSGKNGFLINGKDENGDAVELFRSYHQNDSSRTTADAVNYKGRTDSNDNIINRRALDEALATVTGASLATKTIAGTVKVNVTSSEVSATSAAYRNNDGLLYVMKAATGTSADQNTGAQRGVAAFHSDSFSGSNGFITLKAATSSKLGGVMASSSSSDSSSAFCIEADGKGKIRNNSSSTVGVQKRGMICTTSGAPSSSNFSVGQIIMRTDTKAVYIRV